MKHANGNPAGRLPGDLLEKYAALRRRLASFGSVAVAFSGGADSTFLLKCAHDTLGGGAVAVTARSCSFPMRELEEAQAFCKAEGIRHIVVESEELDIEGFRQNPVNRCYLCKRELFEKMIRIARENGIETVAEGSNMDDLGDYRPGLAAVGELGIQSPLREAGLSKREIRDLSRAIGLSTWDKPSFACLASRFPYGEEITEEKLGMVGRAEAMLHDFGLRQARVRIHGKMARIEADPAQFGILLEHREEISAQFKSFGFSYVSMDLDGYRAGSMNEVLSGREASGCKTSGREASGRGYREGGTDGAASGR